MKLVSSLVVTALMFMFGVAAVPASAQESTTPAAVTDPLNNYTLDALIPVRSADQTSAQLDVAKKWLATSSDYRDGASKAKELVKTRISTKELEVKALEARTKEAKATGDKAEIENIKQQVKVQKDQLDALERIQGYSGEWDDLANAMENAGQKWIAFLEAEHEVAQTRQQAAKRTKKTDDPLAAGMPTEGDFKTHKQFMKATEEYAQAMERYGKALQQLTSSSSKVMSDWEKRSLAK